MADLLLEFITPPLKRRGLTSQYAPQQDYFGDSVPVSGISVISKIFSQKMDQFDGIRSEHVKAG